jgi:hypothetical protein
MQGSIKARKNRFLSLYFACVLFSSLAFDFIPSFETGASSPHLAGNFIAFPGFRSGVGFTGVRPS